MRFDSDSFVQKMHETTEEILKKRVKILEDFGRAYLAANEQLRISDLELVEVRGSNEYTWFFRIRDNSDDVRLRDYREDGRG